MQSRLAVSDLSTGFRVEWFGFQLIAYHIIILILYQIILD